MPTPIRVTRSSMPPFEEYVAEIAPIWESHWLTNMGEKHQQFERELESYLEVDDVALFTNGHNALECIIDAFELGRDGRKKVITTPFTFASTTHAIVRRGLTPVFADIKPSDYTIDPACIEVLIDDETCAIIPVHVYGDLCDTDAIADIAARHGLVLIYDAAHAFGMWRDGVSAATFGDASMYSLHATKSFHTIEGGMVAFSENPALKERLNRLKNFGMAGHGDYEIVGGNAKMNEFCAAMGICNLRHFEEEVAKRHVAAERYWDRLEGVRGVGVSRTPKNVKPNHTYMPVVFEDEFGATRDEVFDALAAEDIKPSKYFYPLVSDLPCYAGRFDSTLTPVAKHVVERVMTLPLYAGLSVEDVDRICDIVIACGR